jgi:hypothetical protein
MHAFSSRIALNLCLILLAGGAHLSAQEAPPQDLELYHIHFVKAAPGKLPELIEAYLSRPAPAAGQPQVAPVILRHREGSDWDLVTITPLGKETTLSAETPSQEIQEYYRRLGPLSAWHGDSFTVGPSWSNVKAALVPAEGAQGWVYVVSDYRSLPGHRQQLRQVLDGNAQNAPGRSALFAHVEGAPWNFLTVTRYNSWSQLGEPPPASGDRDAGMPIREHLAAHSDTIAVFLSGGQPIR